MSVTDEDYKRVAEFYGVDPNDQSAVDHFYEAAYKEMSTIGREKVCLKLLKSDHEARGRFLLHPLSP